MTPVSLTLSEMESVARAFCELVDALGQGQQHRLGRLTELLPRLQAAATRLEQVVPADPVPLEFDPDARFELFSRLRCTLGRLDGYWLEFDHWVGDGHQSGSLADDLADIYFDLKEGLRCLERQEPERAARAWNYSYRVHWGQHLVDANRYLYTLRSRALIGG